MGKTNFPALYKKCKAEVGGNVTIKQSCLSDTYKPHKNYAGIVVYAIDGNAKWMNSSGGRANGFRGRSFYAVIQCTDDWPDGAKRAVGNGQVHHYLLYDTFGIEFHQDRIACGGFSYVNGELCYSSAWLNARDQIGAESDQDKYLSKAEQKLVSYIFEDWKTKGTSRVVPIPLAIERSILGMKPAKSVSWKVENGGKKLVMGNKIFTPYFVRDDVILGALAPTEEYLETFKRFRMGIQSRDMGLIKSIRDRHHNP